MKNIDKNKCYEYVNFKWRMYRLKRVRNSNGLSNQFDFLNQAPINASHEKEKTPLLNIEEVNFCLDNVNIIVDLPWDLERISLNGIQSEIRNDNKELIRESKLKTILDK